MDIFDRSYERIRTVDLHKLVDLAKSDLEDLFIRKPYIAERYRDRILCIALCQGAALHYIDGENGIKDFDVWTFFRANPEGPFPYRRNKPVDFGDPRFGKTSGKPNYIGRCVDMLGRSIDCGELEDPIQALRGYLSSLKTRTARKLSEKAVVLLWPEKTLGTIVWPYKSQ